MKSEVIVGILQHLYQQLVVTFPHVNTINRLRPARLNPPTDEEE